VLFETKQKLLINVEKSTIFQSIARENFCNAFEKIQSRCTFYLFYHQVNVQFQREIMLSILIFFFEHFTTLPLSSIFKILDQSRDFEYLK
jgi:hypothetical protein